MKFMDKIDKFSPLDITLFIVFIVYIILPIGTPDFMAGYVNSPLGILILFIVTVFLFLYTNPILAVLYIFVAYELIRRSNHTLLSSNNASYTQPPMNKNQTISIPMNTSSLQPLTQTPTQGKQEGFQEKTTSLEEYMVNKMAPIGNTNSDTFLSSSYQPVCGSIKDASLFCSNISR